MKKNILLYFSLFTSHFSLLSQTLWYFGNGAGLDFSSGKAILIHNGKLFTLEGCASACDENGNLLFYTDGVTVWNHLHEVMQNGQGLNGSYSSTQSALIIPHSADKKKFFIFTTDEKGGDKGLCYSLVDLSLNNGKGTVTIKNKKLLSPVTEKLTAVSHQNGKDYWVIAHAWNSNAFYAYLVSGNGISQPVISFVGTIHTETGAGNNREAIGYMTASYDGKKIAVAICYREKNNTEVFDFDKATGKISNQLTLSLDGFPYGLCFSQDNSKLYVSFLQDQRARNARGGIVQYDFTDNTVFSIVANEQENSFGALQLGKDGKIYVAQTGNFLDVIESPNEKGLLCNYRKNAIDLFPASCNYGLPNVIPFSITSGYGLEKKSLTDCIKSIEKPFSSSSQLLITEISVCENEYILDAKNPGATFLWSGPSIVTQNTQKIKVDTSGIYRVSVIKDGCTLSDSIRVRFRKDFAVFRYLPKFNPKSEFVNAEFYYTIEDVSEFELKVFDRKKRIVFETKNPNVKWNGRNKKGELVAEGEYLWSVKYKPLCPKESKVITKEGKVIVLGY
jgi:hypothetical protein